MQSTKNAFKAALDPAAELITTKGRDSSIRESSQKHLNLTQYLTPPRQLRRFESLWSLSLYGYTSLQDSDLSAISSFAALGFLDLSATDINLKMLQQHFRCIHIFRLHLFNCPNLNKIVSENPKRLQTITDPNLIIVDRNTQGLLREKFAPKPEELHGFLTLILPDAWCINGIVSLVEQRRYWEDYFSRGGKGQWSVLIQMYYIAEKQFVPTRTRMKEEANAARTIWTTTARLNLDRLPTVFNMPMEQDIFRIDQLGEELTLNVKEKLPEFLEGADWVDKSVRFFLAVNHMKPELPIDNSTSAEVLLEGSFKARASLAILLFVSTASLIPSNALLAAVEHSFGTFTVKGDTLFRKRHWATPPISPLSWSLQDRLFYLSLLAGTIWLDLHSDILSHTDTDEEGIKAFRRLEVLPQAVEVLHKCIYARLARTRKSSKPKNPDFSFLSLDMEDKSTTIDFSAIGLDKNPLRKVALIVLECFHFLCAFLQDAMFVDIFDKLQAALTWCAQILVPHYHPRRESLEENDLFTESSISSIKSNVPPTNPTGFGGRAFELKLRMFEAVDLLTECDHAAPTAAQTERIFTPSQPRYQDKYGRRMRSRGPTDVPGTGIAITGHIYNNS
ncbi:hypothetical protein HDU76_006326 [Blyttiomyces sp. JEL0837]|nr:hypothetical protein HDU76_006326 [Blyttiomyces sp. JEL0837]